MDTESLAQHEYGPLWDIPVARVIKGMSAEFGTDLRSWPSIDIGALSLEERCEFLERKKAILLYLQGVSEKQIRETCCIKKSQVYRLITERCIIFHPDGRPYGWRALLKHTHIHEYIRKTPITVDNWGLGASGALQIVFDKYPEIRRGFEREILSPPSQTSLSTSTKVRRALFKWLLDELRKKGMDARNEWPFCTQYLGYRSIARFIDKVLSENPSRAAMAMGGPDLARKLEAGDGSERPVSRLLQRVEADAHKLDGLFAVMLPTVDGDWVSKIVHRIWVVVIVEIISRCVLGYHISVGREVSKSDVLLAIKSSVTRWRRISTPCCGLTYIENASLPSALKEEFVGLCYDEFSVDGALANICGTVEMQLKDVVGAQILHPQNSYAKRRTKDDRPYIERFFGTLASGGFQKLNNTTGANTVQRAGTDPAKIALASQFSFEYAIDLLDVLIANYNATPHKNLSWRTPLEVFNYRASRKDFHPRFADPVDVSCICSARKKCTVKGGYKVGRQPYVNFYGATYSAPWLEQRHELVGQELWVLNNDEFNAGIVLVSTLEGEILGNLAARPPWNKSPHSLRLRRAINSLAARKIIHFAAYDDPMIVFTSYAELQRDKKLPVPPAYLEFRYLIQTQYEQSGDMASSAIKDASIRAPQQQKIKEIARDESNAVRDSGTDSRTLPMRRPAVIK